MIELSNETNLILKSPPQITTSATLTTVKPQIKIIRPKTKVIKGLSYRRINQRHEPNDSISNAFFNQVNESYESRAFTIDESQQSKFKNLKTIVKIKYPDEVIYFNYLHRLIMNVCISEQVDGNEFLPVDSIFRGMAGIMSHKYLKPTMQSKILQGLKELNSTKVEFDLSAIAGKWKNYGIEESTIKGAIIPGHFLKAEVNGKETSIFIFDGNSPFYTAALAKNNQILTYDLRLLDLPIDNTNNIVMLKNYLMKRIQTSIQHAQMRQTVLIDTIFNELGFNFDKTLKYRYIKYIDQMFNYWQQMGVIKTYSIPKEKGSRNRIIFECERADRAVEWLKHKQKLKRK